MHETMSTGVRGLDAILPGGLPRGHLYLLEGDPGAGKTTLALQFLLEGRDRGEQVLYCTLSETRSEIEQIARSHGWDLDGVTIFELSTTGEDPTGAEAYTVFSPADIELGETTKRLIEQVERVRPARVVIDSLSELRLMSQELLRYRRQILGLKHYFAADASTVLLLDDRTAPSSDLQPRSIAHGVIELDRMSIEYGAERRRVRIVKLRGASFTGGYHDFVIRRGGLAVFPRLSGAHDGRAFDETPATTGVEGLDALLGGGLDRGTSTLLIGPAGTGKSTLAMSIIGAAAGRGERCAVFGFEENIRTVMRRARQLGMGIDRHAEEGVLSIRSVLPAELSPGEFADLIRESVDRDGARVVLIDSLNGYLNSMPEERFLAAQLHELLGFLNGRGVVTIMVLAQRNMTGPAMPAVADVSYLADTVVMLRLFEAFGAVHKAVSVLKKRTGAHETTIRELHFGVGGVRLGKALTDFRGVLTGVPVYVGEPGDLADRDGHGPAR